MLTSLFWRIYQDFLMPSRLQEYDALLHEIDRNGYEFLTCADYACRRLGGLPLPRLVCLLRVDVDSDVDAAVQMFDRQQRLGLRASFYFRLSTLDPEIMRVIAAQGSEVGYHYEEVATIAKRLRLKTRDAVMAHMELMREEFRSNFRRFSTSAGFAPATVASHGDFANRRLNVPNTVLIDTEIREELGILAEAYDPVFESTFESRIIDRELPVRWSPETPHDAMRRGARVMRILVHPRQWQCNRKENLRQEVVRLVEGARFRVLRLGALISILAEMMGVSSQRLPL